MRRPSLPLLIALGLAASGCGLGDEDDTPPPPASAGREPRAAEPAPAPAGPAPAASPPAASTPMSVLDVQPSPRGGYVLRLIDEPRSQILPIFIGDAEGGIIQRRLAGRPFIRPLTHDLLDNLVRTLGGTVVQVEIDALEGNIFVGYVHVWDGERMHRVDSRSSDAVAVALGHRVPIYVADRVLAAAAVTAR